MIRLLVHLFILYLVIAAGWYFGRDYVPAEYRNSTVGNYANVAVDVPLKWARRVLHVASPDAHYHRIKEVSSAQIVQLLQKSRSDYKPVVLYLYSTACSGCSVNLGDMQTLGRMFESHKLRILAIAVERDRSVVSNALASLGDTLNFNPLMMSASEFSRLTTALGNLGNEGVSDPPYLAVVGGNGLFTTVPPGVGRINRLENILRPMVR